MPCHSLRACQEDFQVLKAGNVIVRFHVGHLLIQGSISVSFLSLLFNAPAGTSSGILESHRPSVRLSNRNIDDLRLKSFSPLFQSYKDDGRVIMKGCAQ